MIYASFGKLQKKRNIFHRRRQSLIGKITLNSGLIAPEELKEGLKGSFTGAVIFLDLSEAAEFYRLYTNVKFALFASNRFKNIIQELKR